jgi:hypothetical protein
MKSNGFRKAGHNFSRRADGFWLILNVQSSKWDRGDEGKFTINLGVHSDEVAALVGKPSRELMPKEYECALRSRIGFLMPAKSDYWWQIDSTSDLPAISQDLAMAAVDFGLPWLTEHADLKNLSMALKEQPSLWSTAVALAMDDRQEAARRINNAIEQRPSAKDAFSAWAKSAG